MATTRKTITLVCLAITFFSVSSVFAAHRVVYAGDGRYVCSGSQKECAPYEKINRDREEARTMERNQRELLEEQRKQTSILEEISRKGK